MKVLTTQKALLKVGARSQNLVQAVTAPVVRFFYDDIMPWGLVPISQRSLSCTGFYYPQGILCCARLRITSAG